MYYFITAIIAFGAGMWVDRLYLVLRDAANTLGDLTEGRRPSDEVRTSTVKVVKS